MAGLLLRKRKRVALQWQPAALPVDSVLISAGLQQKSLNLAALPLSEAAPGAVPTSERQPVRRDHETNAHAALVAYVFLDG